MVKAVVLIVGGGPAGMTVAAELKRAGDVYTILVDRKEYFEVNFVSPRALVDPRVARDQMLYNYHGFGLVDKFIQGEIVKLDSKHAMLKKGTAIVFDYAVVCTGSSYSSSLFKGEHKKMSRRMRELVTANQSVNQSQHIVVVGGNFVGCEVAAELTELKHKPKITIVHSHAALMHSAPAKTQLEVRKFFAKKNVHVMLNQRVEKTKKNEWLACSQPLDDFEPDESVSGTDSMSESPTTICDYDPTGIVLTPKPDLVLWTTGSRPIAASFLEPGLGKGVLTAKGYVKVTNELRIEGCENLFAIGDCNNVKEFKTAASASDQGRLAAKNILKLINGQKLAKKVADLEHWTVNGGHHYFYVNLGPKNGVLASWTKSLLVPGQFKGMMKHREILLRSLTLEDSEKYRKGRNDVLFT
eukprot:CAMPEP_0182441326 /NCGR_PEP_ID=MMETSP1172-20130603/258_1 /TAXON_ID=708627 /ORGANISM="Timspurckia oligopyrenoides, Strain CCMP3278" /LENGTH=411 /DNA_ID=CAMNT_0024635523 /DNA_START=239 /DNA_END=1474 /DNA_ORIENTATION=+